MVSSAGLWHHSDCHGTPQSETVCHVVVTYPFCLLDLGIAVLLLGGWKVDRQEEEASKPRPNRGGQASTGSTGSELHGSCCGILACSNRDRFSLLF